MEECDIEWVDEKEWTGLIWAVINNHQDIVRLILGKAEKIKMEKAILLSENQAIKDEKEKEKAEEELKKEKDENDFSDVFKKPLNPANFGKYNPLHWSAYKGNVLITSILIKAGYKPIDIDNYGNTALHQAAASNNFDLFKLFMGLGIDIEVKNARNHMPLDLTSSKEIKDLIFKSLEIKNCQLCNKQFDFFTKRCFCYINYETVCKTCCQQEYYFESLDSENKEILECRCIKCYKEIVDAEENLRVAIRSNNLDEILKAVNVVKINHIKICPKLKENAEFEIDRLEREKKIFIHLDNLKVVDNHKTIEKSVYLLDEMLRNAKQNNIPLDLSVVERAEFHKKRLLSEKELRKALIVFNVDNSSLENLNVLTEKTYIAKEYNVEAKYTEIGEDIIKKMKLNLGAKEVLDLLSEYPTREYPKPEDNDPKKKSKFFFSEFIYYVIFFINKIFPYFI